MQRHTSEQKIKILNEMAEAIGNGLGPFNKCCEKNKVSLKHVEQFANDPACEEALDAYETAKQIMASKYVDEGRRLIDEVNACTRNAMSAVQKAKYQCEVRFKLAETLDPRNWSSLKDEIRNIQAEIKALKQAIEARNRQ